MKYFDDPVFLAATADGAAVQDIHADALWKAAFAELLNELRSRGGFRESARGVCWLPGTAGRGAARTYTQPWQIGA